MGLDALHIGALVLGVGAMDPAKLTCAGPSASGQRACAHSLAALVTRLPNTPAIVVNDIGDVLNINDLACELFSEFIIRDTWYG
ncbi:hypothetical protein H7I41_04830 [Mycobacterium manitobense]|uniref:Uncharacterized protein n=1 Tax=[Mycobacterium] manitobense TaxID=190147 RepID=A0A9X2YLC7_9MYCO|nr:hypothetical protein [[Mycobacterium] manitobense]MCV7169249.1 hypothetical protein [[Mycobacterium] manitobense]